MKGRFLVTGGSGFLGRLLVRRLLEQGHEVRSIDVEPGPWTSEEKVDHRIVDLRDADAVKAACEDIDGVYHLAAALPIHRSRALIHAVNVDGTRNVLEGARKHDTRFVVFTSTTAVYGLHKQHPITEETPLRPVGPYGESKITAEQVCENHRDQGLHVSVVRPKTFLGPGRLGVFEILFDWISDGKRIPLIGKGHNRYQLLDAHDLIDAMQATAVHPKGSDTFNVAADTFATIREDLSVLFKEAGMEPRYLPLPRRTVKTALWCLDVARLSPLTKWHYGTMDQDSWVDTTKITRLLDWQPKASNQDTLLAAYRWYREHRDELGKGHGTTHTVPWDQRVLGWFKRLA